MDSRVQASWLRQIKRMGEQSISFHVIPEYDEQKKFHNTNHLVTNHNMQATQAW